MTLKETVEYFRDMVEGCGAYELCPCFKDDMEMTKIALSALEKQVEKTPKKIGKQHYACPLCDSILNISYDDIFVYEMPLPNYCETCGQSLGWSDVE